MCPMIWMCSTTIARDAASLLHQPVIWRRGMSFLSCMTRGFCLLSKATVSWMRTCANVAPAWLPTSHPRAASHLASSTCPKPMAASSKVARRRAVQEFYVISWNSLYFVLQSMEFYGIPWNSSYSVLKIMEIYGTSWQSLDLVLEILEIHRIS